MSDLIPSRRIGADDARNFLPYYTNRPWLAGDRAFLFFSLGDSGDGTVQRCEPATGACAPLADLAPWRDLAKAEQEAELLGAALDPGRNLLYVPRGNAVIRIDLATGRRDELHRGEPGTRLDGPLALGDDGRRLCCGVYPAPYGGPPPSSTGVRILATGDGAVLADHRLPLHANHFQFLPGDREILFAHEGPTEAIPDRLQALDWRSGASRVLYRHVHAADGRLLECLGHEHLAGRFVVAVRYPVSQIEGGIVLLDPETGICGLLDQDDYWHCSADAAGERFVMDTMWWGHSRRRTPFAMDIVLVERRTRAKRVLATVRAEPKRQIHHPHPQLDAAGRQLLFIDGGAHPLASDRCHIAWMALATAT